MTNSRCIGYIAKVESYIDTWMDGDIQRANWGISIIYSVPYIDIINYSQTSI